MRQCFQLKRREADVGAGEGTGGNKNVESEDSSEDPVAL